MWTSKCKGRKNNGTKNKKNNSQEKKKQRVGENNDKTKNLEGIDDKILMKQRWVPWYLLLKEDMVGLRIGEGFGWFWRSEKTTVLKRECEMWEWGGVTIYDSWDGVAWKGGRCVSTFVFPSFSLHFFTVKKRL